MSSAITRFLLGCKLIVPKGKPFSMIQAKDVRTMIHRKETTRCEIVVLLELIFCSNEEGYVIATADMLAETLKYKPTMVARSLRQLLADGRLEKTNRQSCYKIPAHIALPKARHARGPSGIPSVGEVAVA